jgi:hypothetical protein
MNGTIDPAIEQGFFKFLRKQALATDFRQGAIKDRIAFGFENDDFHRIRLQSGMGG